MLLVLKTRLCFVAFAGHASAKFGIVPNGCPPFQPAQNRAGCLHPVQCPSAQSFPAKNARLSLPLFGWQMVTVRVCSAWPWLITENRCSCLPLYQAPPGWSTQATSCCPHGTSIWELYHGTQCLLFVLTWSSQASVTICWQIIYIHTGFCSLVFGINCLKQGREISGESEI